MSELEPLGAPDPGDVPLLAAALRADARDLAAYAQVLTTTLADALPGDAVTVERDRSLADRLAGRPGAVRSLRVDTGLAVLELVDAGRGAPSARVATVVRGVVISRRDVPVADWVDLLAAHLSARAAESQAARLALGRLLGA